MSRDMSKKPLGYWLCVIPALVVFSAALILLLLLGWQMRLSGDDYCYNAILAQKGFWGMQTHSYSNVSMYNGNRYSLTLLSGFFGLFPIRGTFYLIATSLLAWLGGIVVLLRWLGRRLNISLSDLEALLIAEAFVNMVLWSAPSLEQSFFWRSGMLPYFMPLVGGTWVLVLVYYVGEKQRKRWLPLFFILLASVIVGGFSETGAAFWVGFWAFCLLSLLIWRWLGKRRMIFQYGLPAAAAFLGTALAGLLLAISPSTALRLASISEPMGLGGLIGLVGWNLRVYLWINLMRRTWMLLIPFFFGLGSGFWLVRTRWEINENRSGSVTSFMLVKIIGMIGAATLLLILCVLLPATFVQSDYPPDRALIISQAVLVGAGILGGVVVAVLANRFIRIIRPKQALLQKIFWIICVLLISTSLMAPLQIFQVGMEKLPIYSRWSHLWDLRHVKLVAAGQENVDTIHVMALDHVIEDVGELSADSGYWYNNCAEMYYGVEKIIADQSGW